MPMTADELRKLATSYAPVHGRRSSSHAKKKSQRERKPMRGARAGYTRLAAGARADVWSHKDLAR